MRLLRAIRFSFPPGTVHAIGAGLVLCEIQQRSDITYRLYDYGRPRELHIEHSLAVARREPHSARVASQGRRVDLLRTLHRGRRTVEGASELLVPPGSFALLIVVQGTAHFWKKRGKPDSRGPGLVRAPWYSPH